MGFSAGINYKFKARPWKFEGKGGWYFVSLPLSMSREIRSLLKQEEQGWGRLKASAKIGNTTWQSAIWFDTKHKAYLLPLKAEIRKKEKVEAGKSLEVLISL
jgi:hypothetical protein